jgi:hypothetical protein
MQLAMNSFDIHPQASVFMISGAGSTQCHQATAESAKRRFNLKYWGIYLMVYRDIG